MFTGTGELKETGGEKYHETMIWLCEPDHNKIRLPNKWCSDICRTHNFMMHLDAQTWQMTAGWQTCQHAMPLIVTHHFIGCAITACHKQHLDQCTYTQKSAQNPSQIHTPVYNIHHVLFTPTDQCFRTYWPQTTPLERHIHSFRH